MGLGLTFQKNLRNYLFNSVLIRKHISGSHPAGEGCVKFKVGLSARRRAHIYKDNNKDNNKYNDKYNYKDNDRKDNNDSGSYSPTKAKMLKILSQI